MSAPTALELDLPFLIGVRDGAEMTAQFLVAGTAIFAYDYFLVLGDEFHYLFHTPFTVVKALFLVNRILTTFILTCCWIAWGGFVNLDAVWCQYAFRGIGEMIACLFAVWNWLITIRVHALYGLSPRLKWILSFTFVSVEMATLYLSARESNIVANKAIAAHDIHTCIPGPIPKTFWTIWAPSMCYETTLFIMAMMKLVTRKRLMDSSLRRVLLRDGVLYFVTIMSTRVANVFMFARGNEGNVFIVLFFSIGLNSTSLSRVILNLRNINRNPNAISQLSMSYDRSRSDPDRGMHSPITSPTQQHFRSNHDINHGVRVHREIELTLDIPATPQHIPMSVYRPSRSPKSSHHRLQSESTNRWTSDEGHSAQSHESSPFPHSPPPIIVETPFGPVDVSPDRDGTGAFILDPPPPRTSRIWFPESQPDSEDEDDEDNGRKFSPEEECGSIELRGFGRSREENHATSESTRVRPVVRRGQPSGNWV